MVLVAVLLLVVMVSGCDEAWGWRGWVVVVSDMEGRRRVVEGQVV